MRILFLGAGKRVSLMQRFHHAADAEGVSLELFSLELNQYVPAKELATIIEGPKFSLMTPEYLVDVCQKNRISLVIPNMDTATVLLAESKTTLWHNQIEALVSSIEFCMAMEDKKLASDWFRQIGAPTPESVPSWVVGSEYYPRIFKSRHGFGARDQHVVRDPSERSQFLRDHSSREYLEQPFLHGREFTVDAYVDRGGNLIQAMSRERVAVVGGEVDTSKSYRNERVLQLTRMILSHSGWRGPITLQFIDPTVQPWKQLGPQLIEINPRFGGGVIHSIELGLDFPRWAIQEHLGRGIGPVPQWPDGSIMTRYRTEVFL